jgi:hypothetical protein
MKKRITLIFLGLFFVFELDCQEKAVYLSLQYPNLVTGILSYATISKLPPGQLLKFNSSIIYEKELKETIDEAPHDVKNQLVKNSIFVLEQVATPRILAAVASKNKSNQKTDDAEIAEKHLNEISNGVAVSSKEILNFYNTNNHYFTGVTVEEVSEQIKSFLLNQKKQKYIWNYHNTKAEDLVSEAIQVIIRGIKA